MRRLCPEPPNSSSLAIPCGRHPPQTLLPHVQIHHATRLPLEMSKHFMAPAEDVITTNLDLCFTRLSDQTTRVGERPTCCAAGTGFGPTHLQQLRNSKNYAVMLLIIIFVVGCKTGVCIMRNDWGILTHLVCF